MRRILYLILLLGLSTPYFVVAQQMDAKLNMAKRSLMSIETKLKTLKTGDVSQYNRIGAELTKAATLLKESQSQAHPDYLKSVQNWSRLQQLMASTAQEWQNQTASVSSQQETGSNAVKGSGQVTSVEPSNVDANAILAKYQKQNRPSLGNYPNPSEVGEWAQQMRALQTTELQKDLAALQQANVNPNDANRVSRWINGEFQRQIKQSIKSQLDGFNNIANTAAQLSQQIDAIKTNDKMRAYNFAHGENGRLNTQTLQNGLIATANALSLEEVYPELTNPQRQQQLAQIAMAQQKLESLVEQSKETATELAALPKKQKKKNKNFLKGISQELWYRGRVLASLDKKGSIWMNSRDVGDVTSNGTIWVRGRDLGSVELDGKVWFRGRHVGTLEDNGKVWRKGSQIGLVETNGKVWIDGNANGEITPYEGEWKRAAVVYFFRDFFDEYE